MRIPSLFLHLLEFLRLLPVLLLVSPLLLLPSLILLLLETMFHLRLPCPRVLLPPQPSALLSHQTMSNVLPPIPTLQHLLLMDLVLFLLVVLRQLDMVVPAVVLNRYIKAEHNNRNNHLRQLLALLLRNRPPIPRMMRVLEEECLVEEDWEEQTRRPFLALPQLEHSRCGLLRHRLRNNTESLHNRPTDGDLSPRYQIMPSTFFSFSSSSDFLSYFQPRAASMRGKQLPPQVAGPPGRPLNLHNRLGPGDGGQRSQSGGAGGRGQTHLSPPQQQQMAGNGYRHSGGPPSRQHGNSIAVAARRTISFHYLVFFFPFSLHPSLFTAFPYRL